MRNTEAIINIELVDVTAIEDSKPTTDNNQSFADIKLLKQNIMNTDSYMTLEWNSALLSGEKKHFPSRLQIPFYNTQPSKNDCTFSNPPVITVSFSENHSCAGITLNFHDDYPKELKIEWYDSIGRLMEGVLFYPNSNDYFCSYPMEQFRSLKIIFTKTHFPGRYIKVTSVKYGKDMYCRNDDLSDASIVEELDPISAQLSINTLAFTLLDTNKDFNILNPKGIYSMLQPKQRITVKETLDGEVLEIGTFYLDTWKSKSETQITFHCIDPIGVLDKTEFKKGKVYSNVTAGSIIKEIMDSAGWKNYSVTPEIAAVRLTGYLPVCTHREALQQVCFSARAVADTSRGDKIHTYRPNTDANHKIRNERLFLEGEVAVKSFVSGISVAAHYFKKDIALSTAFGGNLLAGTHEIIFSGPFTDLVISGGALVESGFNYAIVKMSLAGNCKIEGYKYEDIVTAYVYELDNVPPGEIRNTVSVGDATLVSKENAAYIAESILKYYLYRKEAKQRFILENERAGRWVNMQSRYDLILCGCVEQMTIDLTGGFLADATITGYNTIDGDPAFTGKEIYTGERIGVL